MATIRKQNSKWQAIVRKVGHKQQSKVFPKKALAERWANKIETEMAEGIFKDNSKAASTTITNALDRYVIDVLPTRRDKGKVEKSKVNLIRARFGHLFMTSLTADMIEEYVEDRQEDDISNATIIKDLAVIHDLYETADILWHMPCTNPMIEARRRFKKKKSLKQDKGRDRRLVGNEYELLTTADARYKTSNRNKLIIFAVETAMRREEIARIRWTDINKSDGTLHIPRAKHGPRTIPLSDEAMEVLNSLPIRIDGSVWGVKKKSISRLFKRLVKSLNIEDLRFHDLRHEGCSRFFEMGLSIPEVQLITGHGDWRSLQRYTKLKATEVGKKLTRPVSVKVVGNVAEIRQPLSTTAICRDRESLV